MIQAAVKVDPIFKPLDGMTCLNLGSGGNPAEGYINVDIESHPGVDQLVDLEKDWPWPDESIDHIMASDICEHLRGYREEPDPDLVLQAINKANFSDCRGAFIDLVEAIRKPKRTYGVVHFMGEAYRVLKPEGTLDIWVPSTDGRGWAQDPTHVSYWNQNSIIYFLNTPSGESLRMGFKEGFVRGLFNPIALKTSVPDNFGICWVRAILEKPAAPDTEEKGNG